MNLRKIALHIAGYDFRTKMRINALVIEEIAKAAGLKIDDESQLAIMESIEKSDIHDSIQNLADGIAQEAEKLKSVSRAASSLARRLRR